MKIFKYILPLVLSVFVFCSCEDYNKNGAHFSKDDVPEIFIGNDWVRPMNVKVGSNIVIEPLVTPSDGAEYRWTLIDNQDPHIIDIVIATTKNLNYKVEHEGTFMLKFEVVRYDASNSYSGTVIASEED